MCETGAKGRPHAEKKHRAATVRTQLQDANTCSKRDAQSTASADVELGGEGLQPKRRGPLNTSTNTNSAYFPPRAVKINGNGEAGIFSSVACRMGGTEAGGVCGILSAAN